MPEDESPWRQFRDAYKAERDKRTPEQKAKESRTNAIGVVLILVGMVLLGLVVVMLAAL